MKKNVIFITCSILVIIVGILSLNQYRQKEYQRYCQGVCDDKHISSNELEEIKYNRQITAENNIIEYIDNNSNLYTRLSNYNLSSKEKNRLEKAKVMTVYDENKDYDLDDLIIIEKNYKESNDELEKLLHDFKENNRKEVMETYLKEINEYKTRIESKVLSDSEQNDYESINEKFKKIEYDKNKDYPLGVLEDISAEIKSVRREYKNLDSNVN